MEEGCEEMDFRINCWTLRFVDLSIQTTFCEGLIFPRAMILRIILTIFPCMLIYHIMSQAKFSGIEKLVIYIILIIMGMLAVLILLLSFSRSFRKNAHNYCLATNTLVLLMYCLKFFTMEYKYTSSPTILDPVDANYVVVLSALLGFGFHLNFVATAFSYLVYLVVLPNIIIVQRVHQFQESTHEVIWAVIVSCMGGFVSILLTYILMLGRIDNFVNFTKTKVAEKKMQKHAQLNKTQWIAQVAHDLGTPLATFSLGNQMLRDTELTKEQEEIVGTQEIAVELMTLTRNKGMDFAKLESGKALKPHLRPMDVRELVEVKCRKIMTGFGSESPMYFEVEKRIAKLVISDRDWVWEMLINYLNNAQKFTRTGRIVARVTLVKEDQFLRFEVIDTGIGISDDQKKRLFRAYSQLQKGAGGTGLGLNSVMQKAKALGGSVGLRDNIEDGTGAVFWFDIPYQPDITCDDVSPSHALKLQPIQPERQRDCSLAKGTLLVADDERSLLKFMSRSLEKHGFKVETASNGTDAYRLLEEKYYQAVILDDQMPGMHGRDVCKRIREYEKMQSPDFPRQFIVIVSGAPASIPANSGCNHVLGKPVDLKTLLNILYDNICSPSGAEHCYQPGHIKTPTSKTRAKPFFGTSSIPFDSGSEHIFQPCKSPTSRNLVKPLFGSSSNPGPIEHFTIPHRKKSLASSDDIFGKGSSNHSGIEMASVGAKTAPTSPTRSHRSCTFKEGIKIVQQADSFSKLAQADDGFFKQPLLAPPGDAAARKKRQASACIYVEQKEELPVSVDLAAREGFVLVVEDEMHILKFTAQMFQKNNFQVHTAMNGLEALEMMKRNQYTVVFMDINMPVMDGFECVRRFREWEKLAQQRKTRQFICAVTANVSQCDRESAMATGLMDAFVAKPAKIQELIAIVKSKKGLIVHI